MIRQLTTQITRTMKSLLTILLSVLLLPVIAAASEPQADTVVIELEGGSKIIIYTESKTELRDLQDYDINKMISDLNHSLDSSNVSYIELKDEDGEKYRTKPKIVYHNRDESDRRRRDDLDDDDDDWYRADRIERDRRYLRRTRNTWNVELGVNNWLENGSDFPSDNNELYAVRPWGSWYLGLNSNYKSQIAGPLFLQWGFGASWYNFKFQDDAVIMTEGPDMVEFSLADPTLNALRSKLNVTHLNVNFVPYLDFGKAKIKKGDRSWKRSSRRGIRFGLGGYAGYRLGSSTKFVYKEDGDKEKDRDSDNFYLTNLRYGVRMQFGYKSFDVFANYDLSTVFVENKGPDLNAVSFGVIF